MEIIKESNNSPWKKVFPSFKVYSVWYGVKKSTNLKYKNKIFNQIRLITINNKAYLEVKTQLENITFLSDIKNYIKLRSYIWFAQKPNIKTYNYTYYILAKYKKDKKFKTIRFHKLLFLERKITDHINRNGLDNREINLRDGSNGINESNHRLLKNNTSGFNGVDYDNYNKKWVVRWYENKKRKTKYFKGTKEDKQVKQQAIKFRQEIDKKFNIRNGYDPINL